MSKENEWIDKNIDQALESSTSIPESVRNRLRAQLKDQLAERQLSAGKIIEIARELIDGMTESSAETKDTNNED